MKTERHMGTGDDAQGQVPVRRGSPWRRFFSFVGPAYLVSVGYMDPGNWATDLEAGAQFGYALLWVLLMSNIMALLLQTLAARLGIVTGYDLAQGCRREYPRPVRLALWLLAELAIAATDLAEALGTILGLNLLFGLPLLWGCAVTALDTFLLLAIQRLGVRRLEAFIVMLVATIGTSFLIQLVFAGPDWGGIAGGFAPSLPPGALFVAIGMIGATVMPHNLYLHSSLVQTRDIHGTWTAKAEACRYNLIDSSVALNAAFFVNAAILILSAAVFHARGIEVREISEAHHLLEPILGSTLAPTLFALALLAAGQSSTVTGTLSGQVVMEGFVNIRLQPWLRRLLTRSVALLPAMFVIAATGEEGTYYLLILSQVVLSMQLPFAIVPLLRFTSDRGKMGSFVNPVWVRAVGWLITAVIVGLNVALVIEVIGGWLSGAPAWVPPIAVLAAAGLAFLLVYLLVSPWFRRAGTWESGASTAAGGAAVAARISTHAPQRIGVALEHTDSDAEILSVAVGQARLHGARLSLVHVLESPDAMVHGLDTASRHRQEDQLYLEELAREIEDRDLAVDICLRAGQPSREIIAAVRELDLDLLVLGSHGHRGVQDLIFGQTVTSVRHAAGIPVIVVPVSRHASERPQKDAPPADTPPSSAPS